MATAAKQSIYWDSCVWIRLINKEPGCADCEYCIEQARGGAVQIWTSSLALAEVFKTKIGPGKFIQLAEVNDQAFEDFIQQSFVTEVQVDHDVAVKAREMCRKYSLRVNDAIHLASAVAYNIETIYTTDAKDLIALSGKVLTSSGKPILICLPPAPPPKEPETGPLFQ